MIQNWHIIIRMNVRSEKCMELSRTIASLSVYTGIRIEEGYQRSSQVEILKEELLSGQGGTE